MAPRGGGIKKTDFFCQKGGGVSPIPKGFNQKYRLFSSNTLFFGIFLLVWIFSEKKNIFLCLPLRPWVHNFMATRWSLTITMPSQCHCQCRGVTAPDTLPLQLLPEFQTLSEIFVSRVNWRTMKSLMQTYCSPAFKFYLDWSLSWVLKKPVLDLMEHLEVHEICFPKLMVGLYRV